MQVSVQSSQLDRQATETYSVPLKDFDLEELGEKNDYNNS
jgi:hypothetical protein